MELPSMSDLNMGATLPALSVAIWACALLLIDLFVPKGRKHVAAWLAAGGLVFAFIVDLMVYNNPGEAFYGMFVADRFSSFLNIVVLFAGFITILMSVDYLRRTGM